MSAKYGVTEYPNTFKRQSDFPLDKTSKFENLTDAQEYANSSSIAYGGQIISIKESDGTYNPYILQPNSLGSFDLELLQSGNLSFDDNSEITFDGGNSNIKK